jgi:hypothetical protein
MFREDSLVAEATTLNKSKATSFGNSCISTSSRRRTSGIADSDYITSDAAKASAATWTNGEAACGNHLVAATLGVVGICNPPVLTTDMGAEGLGGTSKISYDGLNKLFAPSGIAVLFSVALAVPLGDVCSAKEGRATKFPFSSRQTPVASAEIFLPWSTPSGDAGLKPATIG